MTVESVVELPEFDVRGQSERSVEELRARGQVERLGREPAALMEGMLVGGCRAVGLYSGLHRARVVVDEGNLRLTSEGRIEVTTEEAAVTLAPDRWRSMYRDVEDDRLLGFGRDGQLGVACELEEWDSASAVNPAPRRSGESGSIPAGVGVPGVTIHTSVFDDATYVEAWTDSETYAETHRLERAARTTRAELLTELPERLACAVETDCLAEVYDELCNGGPCALLDLFGAGYRASLDLCESATATRDDLLLAAGSHLHLAIAAQAGGAYLVSLPGKDGASRALELVDGDGRIAARLRRKPEATPSEVLDWRAVLDRATRL